MSAVCNAHQKLTKDKKPTTKTQRAREKNIYELSSQ